MAVVVAISFAACSKESKEPQAATDPQESEEFVESSRRHSWKKTVVISEAGKIDSAVSKFRNLLGPISLNELQTGGRREVTWDDVILFLTNNNNFPGNYFNRTDAGGPFTQKRGIILSTPGNGFRVSNNHFADIDTLFSDEFVPFSATKNFSTLGSNILDIQFKEPGTNKNGYVRGFGAVFSDVNIEGSTYVALYSGNELIGSYKVKIADTGEFSFLGVYFPDKKITRARIRLGAASITSGKKDVCDSPAGVDLVVLDDLIFSNPRRLNWEF